MTEQPIGSTSIRCQSCGYDLSAAAIGGRCPECGAEVAQSVVAPGTAKGATSGMGVASFVCGLISLVIFCAWPISGPLAIVALCLGVAARKSSTRSEGLTTAGIVLSAITLVILVGLFVTMAISSTYRGW